MPLTVPAVHRFVKRQPENLHIPLIGNDKHTRPCWASPRIAAPSPGCTRLCRERMFLCRSPMGCPWLCIADREGHFSAAKPSAPVPKLGLGAWSARQSPRAGDALVLRYNVTITRGQDETRLPWRQGVFFGGHSQLRFVRLVFPRILTQTNLSRYISHDPKQPALTSSSRIDTFCKSAWR